ncbi:MAG TPA: glutamine--fructose-6-phosphate transaminase (isomerizing) [Thermoleophilaceae bacterium]|nr:glutamine--fructose-6-phosphate transaminase (isomerizing) [Thermoleophilaceae bacterium]
MKEESGPVCGIVGYVGSRPCQELLLRGLEKLEYRGYDSAGVAILADGRVDTVRAVGNLSSLRGAVAARPGGAVATQPDQAGDGAAAAMRDPNGEDAPVPGPASQGAAVPTREAPPTTGIGHTRWATHGAVNRANAHPHTDTARRIHVVVNGIVENYADLRHRLAVAGAEFRSDTDAEVVAHVIAAHYRGDLAQAVRRAYPELGGHFAFVAMAADEPGLLVGARRECPLVVGVGCGDHFLASAITAFLRETRRFQLVEDGEIVAVGPEGAAFTDPAGAPIERAVEEVDWTEDIAEKGGFETFMLKEIHEQPDAVAETIADRVATGWVDFGDFGLSDVELRKLQRIVVVACGTSYHAGVVARYVIEEWARVRVEMDIASEYRYRNPVLGPEDLVIGITQSGETRDTLAAMRMARERGAKVLAITNAMGTQATRDADAVLLTRAGLEIGVAATKTFVSQVAMMHMLAIKLAQVRGTLHPAQIEDLVEQLRRLPHQIAEVIDSVDEPIIAIAEESRDASFFLYLGRHVGLPVCLEGALKLREISYIPTDAYAAGEMKHGPIALLDKRTPVVCVATESPVLDKVLANAAEVRVRGAHVIAVGTEGHEEVARYAEDVVWLPRTDWLLQPVLAIVPLQLLAYRIARARGLDVDQPRNLAKTVTVE